MSVVIIDYGSGNLHSAAKAFERAVRDSGSNATIEVTSDPGHVRRAERIVLPGVGAFRDCRDGLRAVSGMWETLEEEVIRRGKPFLGICVGMQLMATRGLEHVETQGFNWIAGDVKVIDPKDPSLKIPHMGWNTLDVARPHALFDGIPLGSQGLHAYFVHSYTSLSPTRRRLSPPPIMAAPSRLSSPAIIWRAASSIPRRANRLVWH